MIGQSVLFAPESTEPLRKRVTVNLITTAQARHTLETFHYLHRARVGRQLNYAVEIDGVVDGVITFAYPMMVADLDGVACNQIVEFARLYLKQNIPHSASCAIGKTLKRIKSDWSQMFPHADQIRLVVSWSDAFFHVGTVYKAANVRFLHRSKKGVGGKQTRGERKSYGDYNHAKDCWVYDLR